MELPPTAIAKGNVTVPSETAAQKLLRAKGYPYPRPDTSFIFVAGDVFLFDNEQWRGTDRLDEIVGRCGSTATAFAAARGVDLSSLARKEQFWPVLAIGSNAGPEQLLRKYPVQDFPDCVVPVVQVALEDFDVVYTPYLATYGSCTATLEHSPGTVTSIFITYLTAPLMERMHATEGGYNLCRLSGLRLHVAPRPVAEQPATGRDRTNSPTGTTAREPADAECMVLPDAVTASRPCSSLESFEVRDWVYQYNHRLGCISLPVKGLGATPIAIADIPAMGRVFPAASQVEMLGALRQALGGDLQRGLLTPVVLHGSCLEAMEGGDDLDTWILGIINDKRRRKAACERLEQHAQLFKYGNYEVVVSLG
ncbi:hypothetical protein Agub_g2256 [Astrephomene gubernaculifera]|uniref:Uncharacterized protein n=1 Tax=Astrephomene gubernaculifera TaxID=47775 RepID=A0AAD3DIW8_9CHLO|nr:hypothetical protein Agub_g2256 [Astrephomene gubernaculifera]